MVKRLIVTFGVMVLFIGALGFVKFRQIQTAMAQAASGQDGQTVGKPGRDLSVQKGLKIRFGDFSVVGFGGAKKEFRPPPDFGGRDRAWPVNRLAGRNARDEQTG